MRDASPEDSAVRLGSTDASVTQAIEGASTIPPRPLGVTLGAAFSAFWGSVGVFITLASVFGSGPYRINGVVVTKSEFLSAPMFLWLPVAASYALVTAYCVFTERYAARRLMVPPWLFVIILYFVVPSLSDADRFAGAGMTVGCLAVALWYLYRKPNVRAYFERLEHRDHRVQ